MLLEPPGSHVRRRSATADAVHLSAEPLRQATVAAAASLALTSSGDAVLLGVALAVAAADAAAGAAAVIAGLACAVRWGSTSLEAVAGAQAVLGPAGAVGPAAAVAASWCAAAALALASPPGWAAVAFGAASALAVAGPSPGDGGDLALRAAATFAGVACAVILSRRVPAERARPAAVALAAAALGLALAS